MSPEQCAGLGELDGRSDVYSLGVVMYECLTGRIPFGGGVSQIVAAHLAQPPLHPSVLIHSIDPALEAVVLRAMEKDPDRRFQTMDEMGGALAATARSPTRAPATRRRRLAVALGTGAAAVVAAGLTLALGTRRAPAMRMRSRSRRANRPMRAHRPGRHRSAPRPHRPHSMRPRPSRRRWTRRRRRTPVPPPTTRS
jgi:serine/threonine-protein kinase